MRSKDFNITGKVKGSMQRHLKLKWTLIVQRKPTVSISFFFRVNGVFTQSLPISSISHAWARILIKLLYVI